MSTPTSTAPLSERELVNSRLINAPRERVFKAWTDSELLKRWFVPLPRTTFADRETHEKIGFREGWTRCIDQLEELLSKA